MKEEMAMPTAMPLRAKVYTLIWAVLTFGTLASNAIHVAVRGWSWTVGASSLLLLAALALWVHATVLRRSRNRA
ncbi:hypothetical protein [Micromonospora sp. NPDC047730]|uniref:hypothetical protein n=1 Tax=Micromonospora sp. NPDC047730 TaxID=3364253 RepID=UPI00371797EC